MAEYRDPVTGKRPGDMNIVEWCDWEGRARHEFQEARRAENKARKRDRRDNRVEWIENLLGQLYREDIRTIAERIDQSYYPEAWVLRGEVKA